MPVVAVCLYGGTYRGVGRAALHAYVEQRPIQRQQPARVPVPEDVGGLLQRLRYDALERHGAARAHEHLRLARDLDARHCDNTPSPLTYCETLLLTLVLQDAQGQRLSTDDKNLSFKGQRFV